MMFLVSLAAPLSLTLSLSLFVLSVLSVTSLLPPLFLRKIFFFQFTGKLRKMKVGWRRDSVASIGESLTQKLT